MLPPFRNLNDLIYREEVMCSDNTKSGLPPIVDDNTTILVLGSLPGDISIKKQEYYADPTNHFWHIIYALFGGLKPHEQYQDRIEFLRSIRVGLWDVLQTAERKGSTDAKIKSGQPNDVAGLLQQYPNIDCVLLNGTTAKSLYRRHSKHARLKGRYFPSSSATRGQYVLPVLKRIERWREQIYGAYESTIIRKASGTQTLFMIDEVHGCDPCTNDNIAIASSLVAEGVVLIGVEGYEGGLEWDYIETPRQYTAKWLEPGVEAGQFIGRYPRFKEGMENEPVKVVGVDCRGLCDQVEVDKLDGKWSGSKGRHKNYQLRSFHFIRTIGELIQRQDLKGNFLINCGSAHNDDIQELFTKSQVLPTKWPDVTYIRIRSNLYDPCKNLLSESMDDDKILDQEDVIEICSRLPIKSCSD